MTKKNYFIFICIAVLTICCCCLALLPDGTAEAAIKEGISLSLSAPQALTTRNGECYIADTIEEDGKIYTIVHMVSEKGIETLFSDKSIEGETNDIEVSADGKTLFLMQNDSILVKGIGNETNISISAAGVFDILVSGDYFFYETKANGKCNSNVVAVTELLGNPDTQIKPSSHGPTKIAFLGVNSKNEGQAIAYYQTTDENGVSKTAQIAISAEGTSDITPDLPYAIGDDTLGTFNYGNSACFFTAEKIDELLFENTSANLWNECGISILDMAVSYDDTTDKYTFFILCDYVNDFDGANAYYNKPRMIYFEVAYNDEKPTTATFYGAVKSAVENHQVLGASELKLPLPEYNVTDLKKGFVRGYPSNIIYTATKVDSDYAIKVEKLTSSDQFVILSSVEDNGRTYHYIMFEGKFGWILDSDCVDASSLTFTAFDGITLNFGGQVYDLPYQDDAFLQTYNAQPVKLEKGQELKVVGMYKEFYFVTYSRNNTDVYGFVLSVNIGQDYAKKEYTTYLRKAANPQAGKSLVIYADTQLDTVINNELRDAKGVPITVKAGKEVRLYEVLEDGVCLVGVIVDNVLYKGYIKSEQMLKEYNVGLTNSQILATACIAIVLVIIVYVVILRVRKKKMLAVQEEAESNLNAKKKAKEQEENQDIDD